MEPFRWQNKISNDNNIVEIKCLFTRYSHTDFRWIHYFAPQNTRKNNSYFTNKYKDLSKNYFLAVLFFFSLRASKKRGESCVQDINQKLQMKLLIVQCKWHIFTNTGILWISHGWQRLAPVLFVRPNIIRFDIDLSIREWHDISRIKRDWYNINNLGNWERFPNIDRTLQNLLYSPPISFSKCWLSGFLAEFKRQEGLKEVCTHGPWTRCQNGLLNSTIIVKDSI